MTLEKSRNLSNNQKNYMKENKIYIDNKWIFIYQKTVKIIIF